VPSVDPFGEIISLVQQGVPAEMVTLVRPDVLAPFVTSKPYGRESDHILDLWTKNIMALAKPMASQGTISSVAEIDSNEILPAVIAFGTYKTGRLQDDKSDEVLTWSDYLRFCFESARYLAERDLSISVKQATEFFKNNYVNSDNFVKAAKAGFPDLAAFSRISRGMDIPVENRPSRTSEVQNPISTTIFNKFEVPTPLPSPKMPALKPLMLSAQPTPRGAIAELPEVSLKPQVKKDLDFSFDALDDEESEEEVQPLPGPSSSIKITKSDFSFDDLDDFEGIDDDDDDTIPYFDG
jgi:hypothetical protein